MSDWAAGQCSATWICRVFSALSAFQVGVGGIKTLGQARAPMTMDEILQASSLKRMFDLRSSALICRWLLWIAVTCCRCHGSISCILSAGCVRPSTCHVTLDIRAWLPGNPFLPARKSQLKLHMLQNHTASGSLLLDAASITHETPSLQLTWPLLLTQPFTDQSL